MIIYRKNTMSDKGISFVSILLGILLISNSIKMYQIIDKIYAIDVAVSIGAVVVGGLFLYTSRLKYLELTEGKLSWYTWFFIKHSINTKEIKKIEAKTYYIIIKKENNKEVWISTRCVKQEDLNKLLEVLKEDQK